MIFIWYILVYSGIVWFKPFSWFYVNLRTYSIHCIYFDRLHRNLNLYQNEEFLAITGTQRVICKNEEFLAITGTQRVICKNEEFLAITGLKA